MRFLQYQRLQQKKREESVREREELWEKEKVVFFDWQLWDTHSDTHMYSTNIEI